MKALNPSTGNLEKVYVKALDSMPVGTVVEYTGQASDIPVGWEKTPPDLFTIDDLESGSIGQDGSEVASDTRLRTNDYIEVLPSTNYTITYTSGNTIAFMYDASKNYISQTPSTWNSSNPYTFTTTATTKYVRVAFNNVTITNATMVMSSEEPHINIKKTSETTPFGGAVVNVQNNSTTDTYSCDFINKNKEIYSTSEQVIGKWIDGKPLYRKVVETTSAATINADTTVATLTNVKKLISYKGMLDRDNTIICADYAYGGGSQTSTLYTGLSSGTLGIRHNTNAQQNLNVPLTLIVEYTKTTD